jgi:elongation factor P
MYTDGTDWHFMDNKNFEQITLNATHMEGYSDFLMENSDYRISFFEGNPISLDLPSSVVLEVVESEPGVKGDSVSNLTKSAKLVTGLQVKVPLFIKVGDKVKVDTRTKEYLERVTG